MRSMALPWTEVDYNNKALTGHQTYLYQSGASTGSIFGQLARVIQLYARSNDLVKSPPAEFADHLSTIYSLEEELQSWWERLPDDLKMRSSDTPPLPPDVDMLPKILLINVFFHQSLCILHSSIVPIFSWGKHADNQSTGLQLSAQVAYDHACEVSRLIQVVLSDYGRLSAITSFIAYAAYCGCAIQIPFMTALDGGVRARSQANVKSNVRMIEIMSEYWKIAGLLRLYVGYLIKMHKRNPIILEGEPKHSSPAGLVSSRNGAAHTRMSILEYVGILRPEGDGYVKPGDECDLRAEDENFATGPPSRASPEPARSHLPTAAQSNINVPVSFHRKHHEQQFAALPTEVRSGLASYSQPNIDSQYQQYRPEVSEFLGPTGSEQFHLVDQIQDGPDFNPIFGLQPWHIFQDQEMPDFTAWDQSPLNFDYLNYQQNPGGPVEPL